MIKPISGVVILLLISIFMNVGCKAKILPGKQENSNSGAATDPNTSFDKSDNAVRILLLNQNLPDCDDSIIGATYYVIGSKSFVYCDGSAWGDINLNGSDGEPGAIGATGATGKGGATGAAGAAGAAGAGGSDGLNSLISLATESPGANCSYGGKKINAGLDADRNGSLAVGEITTSSYLCNDISKAVIRLWVREVAGNGRADIIENTTTLSISSVTKAGTGSYLIEFSADPSTIGIPIYDRYQDFMINTNWWVRVEASMINATVMQVNTAAYDMTGVPSNSNTELNGNTYYIFTMRFIPNEG